MRCNSENTWDQDSVIQLIESYRENQFYGTQKTNRTSIK
jgi:hypothetical protein